MLFGAHVTQLLAEKGEGIDVIVIRVDDLDRATQHLSGLGLDPVGRLDHGDMREARYDSSRLFGLPLLINEYREVHPQYWAGQAYLRCVRSQNESQKGIDNDRE